MGEIRVRGRKELSTRQGVQTAGMTRGEVVLGDNSCAVEVRTQPAPCPDGTTTGIMARTDTWRQASSG